jgi:hypothetical protein
MLKTSLTKTILTTAIISFGIFSLAEETVKEKVDTGFNKAVDSTKEAYRNVDDQACEMINGKMQCLGKKIKHKVKTMSEKTETNAKEIKKKIEKTKE